MLFQELRSKLAPVCKRFAKSKDGIAAIEFAFIAPIMIAFYFGVSELSMAIAADREVAHTASVAGDLATQLTDLGQDDVEDIMTASLAVLGIDADERADVTVELNSYRINPLDGTIETVGYARMGPQITKGGPATFDPSSLGSNMLNATSGVVVARVNFRYKPLTLKFAENMTLHETFYLKPRRSLSVPFDEGGSTNFSCTAGTDLNVSCSAS